MAANLLFTINIDVDEGELAYEANLVDIRGRLAVGNPIEGRPILAPQVAHGGVLHFFDVNLTGGGYTLQTRYRADNLYFLGYRPPGSNVWWEVNHGVAGAPPVIVDPNTTTEFLPFGANYNNLTGPAGITLSDVPLGTTSIAGAITTLSLNNPNSNRARAILIIVFTISEASRFRAISDLIVRSWYTGSTPGDLTPLVLNWARMSSAVQRTRNDGHTFDFDTAGISSFAGAILALGIMHLANPGPGGGSGPRRFERSIADVASGPAYAQGQPLLEIFSVTVNNIDGENPGDLYGTITVTDSAGTENIWVRTQQNHISIKPGDTIPLEGPSRPLYAADEFYIDVDLFDYDSVSSNESIAKGTISFNAYDYYATSDVLHHDQVSGDHGSVSVSYMAITDALYAQISVILINGDNENPADVYGRITGNNGFATFALFGKASNESVSVKPQDPIPLSRAIVAVPTDQKLEINVLLWDHDSTNPDDEIANGFANFSPLYKQSASDTIKGVYGSIQVRVSWM
ncbi:hypothetical protein D9757_010788 [Collybiopsis confluens]|uniref:DUF6598 domain-containing protein n=1 Tax=Collybiopsis confluens TaxID=2823264 RepID=A0A8H5M2B3_9AGAR|nr:hypothetical protein D9757_010788 [Collybiopsis confluens]